MHTVLRWTPCGCTQGPQQGSAVVPRVPGRRFGWYLLVAAVGPGPKQDHGGCRSGACRHLHTLACHTFTDVSICMFCVGPPECPAGTWLGCPGLAGGMWAVRSPPRGMRKGALEAAGGSASCACLSSFRAAAPWPSCSHLGSDSQGWMKKRA